MTTPDIVEKIQAGNWTSADVDAAVQEILRLRMELAEALRLQDTTEDDYGFTLRRK
jgi:hypothetical protein